MSQITRKKANPENTAKAAEQVAIKKDEEAASKPE